MGSNSPVGSNMKPTQAQPTQKTTQNQKPAQQQQQPQNNNQAASKPSSGDTFTNSNPLGTQGNGGAGTSNPPPANNNNPPPASNNPLPANNPPANNSPPVSNPPPRTTPAPANNGGGGGAPAGGGGGTGGAGNTTGGGGGGDTGAAGISAGAAPVAEAPAELPVALDGPVDINTLLALTNGDAELANALALIAQDPEGAVLIQAAVQKGVKFQVGGQGPGAKGETEKAPNGETIIRVDSPGNIATLAHELVHATAGGQQDSKREEVVADVIGSRISERTIGVPGDSLQEALQEVQTAPVYKALPDDTGEIDRNLAALGINAGV